MSQSRRNLARSYLLIYGVSGAGISATNQARSTLRHGQKISTTPNAEMSIFIFCPRYPEFSFFSVTKMPLLSVEVQVFCDSDTWAHYLTFTDQVTSYFYSLMFYYHLPTFTTYKTHHHFAQDPLSQTHYHTKHPKWMVPLKIINMHPGVTLVTLVTRWLFDAQDEI